MNNPAPTASASTLLPIINRLGALAGRLREEAAGLRSQLAPVLSRVAAPPPACGDACIHPNKDCSHLEQVLWELEVHLTAVEHHLIATREGVRLWPPEESATDARA